MPTSNSQHDKVPAWVWCSLVPAFGALSIIYAGVKSKTQRWIYLGLGIFVAALVLASHELAVVVWVAQIVTAFYLRRSFLKKVVPTEHLSTYGQVASLPGLGGKVDINRCSKDELVRVLGLPIVYANNIELIQNEGYLFTHLEELSEIAGLPESYLSRIEPLVMFTYDCRRDSQFSWRRVNSFDVDELIAVGVHLNNAERIVAERQKGDFKSVADLQKRTKISFKDLEVLL